MIAQLWRMKYTLLIGACLMLFACQNEGSQSSGDRQNIENSGSTNATEQEMRKHKYILFFGNSLTAGYGLDEDQSFPSLIQSRLDSMGLPYQVINGGLSGETSAGGLNRIEWVLRQQIDVFVLELGPNDALRGLDLESTEKNLRGILQAVLFKYPDAEIVVAGMEAPPNMGAEYTAAFRAIYPALARDYNAKLIPFLLEGVAAKPELNLPDLMHPNAEGQKIVRDNVWKALKDVLKG